MKVLIACEYSGTVRDAFIAKGHDAMSCDLLPTAKPGPHYQGDVRDVLYDGWDLMIAHPDCTYLTVSAEWAYADKPKINGKPRNMKPGTLIGAARREAREQALDFVALLMDAPIKRIAIENPVGAISTRIKKPDQMIQPYQFGHNASKRTGLWLKNLPKLRPLPEALWIEPRMVADKKTGKLLPRWANQTDSGQNILTPSDDRGLIRAKTYQGWAFSMATQWSFF